MEKRLIVYLNDEPIQKFYVKAKHTLGDIQNHFKKKGYDVSIYNGETPLVPYDFDKITDGKIILTRPKILTGIRGVDLTILSDLDDRDLFNFCLSNKEASDICRDENFWRSRFYQRYGQLFDNDPEFVDKIKPKDVN